MMASVAIFHRLTWVLALGVALVAAGPQAPAAARASKAQKAQPAAITDPEQAIDAARKALAANKLDEATRLADVALTDDKRDPRNTARALAVRGEVRLRQNRVAEAIADLDNALWVKGGLAGAERQSALTARTEAYAQIGATGPAVAAQSPVGNAAASPPPPPSPPAQKVVRQQTRAARPEPVAVAPVAVPPPPPSPAREVASSASDWSVATRPARATVAAAEPGGEAATGAATPTGAGLGSVGNFFSSLFGLNKSSAPVAGPAAARQVDSTTPTGSLAAARSTPRVAAVSSSTPQTDVVLPRRRPPIEARPSQRTARLAPASVTADVTPEPRAAFQLQLAAVRTPAEARQLGATVRDKHPEALKERTFNVEETVFGNMGRFYRVRIGTFASQVESQAVCASIRNSGHDCMVIER